jgi:hypothetical protein
MIWKLIEDRAALADVTSKLENLAPKAKKKEKGKFISAATASSFSLLQPTVSLNPLALSSFSTAPLVTSGSLGSASPAAFFSHSSIKDATSTSLGNSSLSLNSRPVNDSPGEIVSNAPGEIVSNAPGDIVNHSLGEAVSDFSGDIVKEQPSSPVAHSWIPSPTSSPVAHSSIPSLTFPERAAESHKLAADEVIPQPSPESVSADSASGDTENEQWYDMQGLFDNIEIEQTQQEEADLTKITSSLPAVAHEPVDSPVGDQAQRSETVPTTEAYFKGGLLMFDSDERVRQQFSAAAVDSTPYVYASKVVNSSPSMSATFVASEDSGKRIADKGDKVHDKVHEPNAQESLWRRISVFWNHK